MVEFFSVSNILDRQFLSRHVGLFVDIVCMFKNAQVINLIKFLRISTTNFLDISSLIDSKSKQKIQAHINYLANIGQI